MSEIERLPDHHLFHTTDEMNDLRRTVVRFARTFPPGPERNQHRQIALSLRALFKNPAWILDHVVEDRVAMP